MALHLNISKGESAQGVWSGMPITDALKHYKQLYALGVLTSLHFGVDLEPFNPESKIATHLDSGVGIPLFDPTYKLPWLCQSIDLSLLDAQTDSVNVGAFQLNHITGHGSGEISIPFIETRNAAIMNSAKAIKEIMFPKGEHGGTQALPKDYLMRMTIFIYDRHSYSTRVFEVQHLVALQTGSIPLDATNRNGIGIVTLNFIKMFPMLTP
ncbi:hypothetical protein [Acinetobacter sp. NIPH 2699]|uniref:hypothetical protein n=1 Tax=Acinetobacter sp. NIPH 2699 TaxID=2923433 RepID=UPI001F4A29B5|nr:hypothetical protein [Acinetobacter sp. NIPH 2699]MCH7335193.1 hypothetical protein [Acinetobacter sp. NIPH 2699]